MHIGHASVLLYTHSARRRNRTGHAESQVTRYRAPTRAGHATRNTADLGAGAVMAIPELAVATQTHIPQLRDVHIAKAGHNVRRDQFDRSMEAVHAFLRETVAS